MNSFGTGVMRSVDEVFRPILPEPNLVSEFPQGYSQSLTVGPQFESQTNLTQTFLKAWLQRRLLQMWECATLKYTRGKKHLEIYKQRSVLLKMQTVDAFLCHVFFLLLDRVSYSPARGCYSTESMDENVFRLIAHLISFCAKNNRGYRGKAQLSLFVRLFILCWC